MVLQIQPPVHANWNIYVYTYDDVMLLPEFNAYFAGQIYLQFIPGFSQSRVVLHSVDASDGLQIDLLSSPAQPLQKL